MKTIIGDRATGRTTALIEYAAELQDEGHSVIFVVPQATYIKHLFDMMVDVLDMSRVEVHTQWKLDGIRPLKGLLLLEDLDDWKPDNRRYAMNTFPVAAVVSTYDFDFWD